MQRLLLPFRPGTTGCSSRFLFGGALLRACTSPAASARLGLAGLEALEALEGLPGLAGLLRALALGLVCCFFRRFASRLASWVVCCPCGTRAGWMGALGFSPPLENRPRLLFCLFGSTSSCKSGNSQGIEW